MESIQWSEGQIGATDFVIDNHPGHRPVTGAIWLPKISSESNIVVLCGHGASGDRYQDPIPYLVKHLVDRHNIVVLSVDGPVHGLRKVEPGGREAFFQEMQRPTFIDDMVSDWLIAVEDILTEKNIKIETLGYFGLSMGTMFGVPLLASKLEFNASVIGLCGSSGAASMIGERLLKDAEHITHPTTFLMQLEDELFDRNGYLALFDAIQSGNKKIHANPGLHPHVPKEEIDYSIEFLVKHLKSKEVVSPVERIAE